MRRRKKNMPWGRIFGTLTAVCVTLICVVQRIDPLEIVKRTALTFVTVAVITAVLVAALQAVAQSPKRSSR